MTLIKIKFIMTIKIGNVRDQKIIAVLVILSRPEACSTREKTM